VGSGGRGFRVGTEGIRDFFLVFRISELLISDISKCGETWLGLRQRENTGQTLLLQDAFVLLTKPVPGRLGCRRIAFSLRWPMMYPECRTVRPGQRAL
jgi:hypothetical protein